MIIRSQSFDPWYNLALEEFLLKQVKHNQIILYLWQNDNTIVIGRNQNPWKECSCKQFEKEGGKLARRLSGGGAVYHDKGNLNFTFIMDKKLYNLTKQLQVILDAVQSLAVKAEFSGRNDLIANGKKFSGNAFYFDDNAAYHHGTLLINTNFSKMVKYLQVSKEKIASKGIDSVKSRVVNLVSLNNQINIENMAESLLKSFTTTYGESDEYIAVQTFTDDMDKLYQKYSSWQWRYGESPNFDISYYNKFPWGELSIGFTLVNGYITECKVYSDAMDSNLILTIANSFKTVLFKKEQLIKTLEQINVNQQGRAVIEDLKQWIGLKDI
ncbi:lipoate--protein ligase [Clostridium sp. 'deep sea']|nr:lipoate--protein ligase [Clostridium sp. 'deep sea']QOR36974.1 lipoate--protein ligase [Clostridium sp. 'deep sea']